MAEVMTVEAILEADWLLQGYWTRPRFPLRTPDGDWSDIDVLAYKPEAKHLVISESKVRGPKKELYAYTEHTQAQYGDILKFDGDNYFSFLRHIGTICADGVVFSSFRSMVKLLTVHLVSNYVILDKLLPAAIDVVRRHICSSVPKGVDLDVRLETTLDVICRIIVTEGKSSQGRRHGHAVIDMARELNRYMNPQVRYAGRNRQEISEIKAALANKLSAALRGRCD